MDVRHFLQRQSGVTMIESLVAVLVISIGLMGIAGLHLSGLRDTAEAEYYSRAIFLANELVERIRSNRSTSALNAYSAALEEPANATSQECRLPTANCTPAELAQDDVAEWYALLRSASSGLPPPDDPLSRVIAIINDPSSSDIWNISIRINWQLRETYNYTVQTQIFGGS